jgi:hypothetical protein
MLHTLRFLFKLQFISKRNLFWFLYYSHFTYRVCKNLNVKLRCQNVNVEPALVQHPYSISHYWYHHAITHCQIDLHFTARCKKLHILYSNSLPVSLNKIWLSHKSYPYTGLGRPLGLQEVEDPRISRQSA